VKPSAFGLDPEDALEAEVNNKYANRVVFDVGLAICLFDFLKIGDGLVHYGDGCYWYKGVFCYVGFKCFRVLQPQFSHEPLSDVPARGVQTVHH